MALIPPDAGIRMRMQTEADLLQPVQPARATPSELPDLRPGQTFSARIQEVLPDNTYKALVAGRQLTLQLPDGAKSGDLLELVVIDRSAKVVIARQTENSTAANTASTSYAFAKFSPAARLISQLLPGEGEAPPPAQLNRGQPLLPQPPMGQNAAAQLAAALTRSVAQSGLFYESHQAQWVNGKLSLAQLQQEPQGRLPGAGTAPQGTAEAGMRAAVAAQLTLPAGAEKVGAGETAAKAAQTANLAQQVPGELRPLVQQQLEAAATQRMFWHGEAWPQQPIDWVIERGGEREGGGAEDDARWSTALSLTTPRLGRIDAKLSLDGGGVRITLSTPYGASAADLRDGAPNLAAALESAGVPLHAFHVRHEAEPEAAG
jgi:hypothetical protein